MAFTVDCLRDQRDQLLHFKTESETGIFRVSISRPRLKFSKSEFRDRVLDWNFPSLSFETESENGIFRVSVSRPSPRLKFSESQFPVRDCSFLSFNFKTLLSRNLKTQSETKNL